MPETTRDRFKIFLIIMLALCLRVISLNQSFWLDEATSGLVVRNLSFSEIINEFSPNDFHPPLYYLILKFWGVVFGFSEVALRSLSVFLGLASIYFTYKVAGVFGKKTGLLSAVFLALNGLHIYYSQEARMYIVSLFLVTLLMYLFLKILTSAEKRYWIYFSVVLILNAFTDYVPNFVIFSFWVFAALKQKRMNWWKKFVIVHVPLFVFMILWMPFLLNQMKIASALKDEGSLWLGVLGGTNIKNILLVPVKFTFGRISFDNKYLYFMLSAFVLSVYSVIIFKGKKLLEYKFFPLFLLWMVLPFVLIAIVSFQVSIFSYFRLIFILPAFLIILAVSVINLPKKWRNLGIVFIIIVNTISSFYYLVTPKFHRENWRSLVTHIRENSERNEYAVVFASGGQTEGYEYYDGSNKWVYKISQLKPDLKKLWYIRYVQDIFDPADMVVRNIESLNYHKTAILNFNGIVVWVYENSN